MKPMQTLALAAALGFVSPFAQAQEKPAAAAAAQTATPLKLQVVIARYQGEKKISSLPYALSVNANGHASLRMGARISVAMAPIKDGPQTSTYQDVGTNIDCDASVLDDGRFRIQIAVDDSSVYPDDAAKSGGASTGNPSFRTFRASDSMVLRDGQTAQFTTATDKVTGETVKVDVTLTVLK